MKEVELLMAKKTVAQLWEEIFEKYNILDKINENGMLKITADQIREFKEPRLMAKFDYSKQLPSVFKNNGLGILPIKNGEYVIGKFNLFEKLTGTGIEKVEIKKVQLPDFIETIDPDNIYSESNALNVALLSGMLNDAFEEELFETIQGKMRTNEFKFEINSVDNVSSLVNVNGAVIEIDGGYEGRSKLVLIEAKNNLPDDFIIRQLYYPYRFWKAKVAKIVIPAFFAYENGIYNIFIYNFNDDNNYNSLELNTIKRYMLSSESTENIKKNIFELIELVDELSQDKVPFPQADSFTKVLGTMEYLNSGLNTANLIAEAFEFDSRQGKYYIDALRYLDIAQSSNVWGEYELTDFGKHLMELDVKNRNRLIIQKILSHKPFYEVYKGYLENEEIYNRGVIKDNILNVIPQLSDETANRRASIVRGWIEWIIGAQI
ncbi:MAG: type II restriction enzyme [Candidatus Coprovivens sp.]